MSQNSESRIQTEENIKRAFWGIFKVKGLKNTTVKDVIKKAGYNRSTFYDYFIDLEDVLSNIEEQVIPTINSLPPGNFLNMNLGIKIDEYIELFKKNKEYYVVLLGENGDTRFASKIKNSVKKSLLSHPHLKNNNSVNIDYILEYLVSGLIGILIYWLSNPNELNENDIITLIKELMPIKKLSNFLK